MYAFLPTACFWYIGCVRIFFTDYQQGQTSSINTRDNYPPWTDFPPLDYTPTSQTFQMSDAGGAILMPNCSNPNVDCSPVISCPYNSSDPNNSTKDSAGIESRQVAPDRPNIPGNLRGCNGALYDVRFVINFIAHVRQWWFPYTREVNGVVIAELRRYREPVGHFPRPQEEGVDDDFLPRPDSPTWRIPHFQVGYVLSPDSLLRFALFFPPDRDDAEVRDAMDLSRALHNNPPRPLVNFFNNPYVNGFGMSSRLLLVYRSLLLSAGQMDWRGLWREDAELLVDLFRNRDLRRAYNQMRDTLCDYLRRRYPNSDLAIEWLLYSSTVFHRAEASARRALGGTLPPAADARAHEFATFRVSMALGGPVDLAALFENAPMMSESNTNWRPPPADQQHKRDNGDLADNSTLSFFPSFDDGVTSQEREMTSAWAYPADYSVHNELSFMNGTAFMFPINNDTIANLTSGSPVTLPGSNNATLNL